MKNRTLPCSRKWFTLIAFVLFFAFDAAADPVGAARARLVAKHFLSNNDARSTGLRDLSAEAGFAHLYVFSTESSFVLVAGDDRMQPVLGYSLNGSFDLDHMPENKAAWIQEYSDAIQYAVEHQTRATSEVLQQWNDLAAGRPNAGRSTMVVAPLLSTLWDQGNPYNLLCPTGTVTGCVATAMAQVMKYWEYPSHGIGSHSYVHSTYGEQSADFQNTTYDWDNMLDTYNGNGTSTQNMAVATLMYHCGVSVNMNYGPSSGAVTAYVADALKTYFNYSSETLHYDRSSYDDDTWINMLKADLNLNRPIEYHGSNENSGHAFVFDGYNSSNYFHVNWGWSGYQDEYYTINGMSPGTGGTGSGSGTYNLYQGAILGAHPSDCVAGDPANLTYTQSGRDITLSWTAASGAVSYNVYRDGSYLGNTTSATYLCVAPYGNSTYWVRSVDANGELSLTSNAVSVTVDYPLPVVDDLQAAPMGNSVSLSWTAPDWCYPSTPTATMTYGEGTYNGYVGYGGSYCMYWGHRYPAASLSAYNNMMVYKVSFYAKDPGSYEVYVYQGTTSDHPQTLLTQQTLSASTTGWVDIDLSNVIQIDASKDLWVFMYDPEYKIYPGAYCNFSGNEGNYYSTNPTSWASHYSSNTGNVAFLIRTFVSDGVYTYNLYRNGSSIANNLGNTAYTDNNLAPGTYNYYVKTNYYGGETNASNQVTVQIGAGNYYTIAATANPSEGGTVSGAGSYLENGSCTLTATANPGYSFVNWTKGQQVVSTNATYTFTVNQAGSYVANFEAASYQITATANPVAGGTVSGTGTYNYNQTCTLVATPAEGYVFASWTKNGNEVSTEASYSFSVTESGAYVANFNEAPIQIGYGEATTGYFPFYTLYNYSIATALFTAEELQTAGITTNPMTSLSWYATNATGYNQQNITLWMANVSDAAVGNASPDASTMTKVYTGSSTPEVGWNRFGFNEGNFSWDGESNIMILCQRNNGSWNSTVNWQSDSTDFYSMAYAYTDNNPYNVDSTSYYTIVHTLRPNTLFELMSNPGQVTALASGWNWWSTYIELGNINGLEMLENSLGVSGIRIQSRDLYTDYYDTYGWWGTLNAISNEQSYRIRTNAECMIVITGEETLTESHPITIGNGWNWIGFPSAQSLSVTTAMSGFTPAMNDQIKGRHQYTTYYGNNIWYGTLETLEPGQGYMYKSNATTSKTLVYQTGRDSELVSNITTEDNHYKPESAEYADNMTITAVIELDGEELRSEAYELAAFVGDECRGSVKLKYVEPLDRYVAFLLVYGDVEEEMNFVLTDGEETLWANESIVYSANAIVGKATEPYVLHFGDATGMDDGEANLVRLYPNPSNGLFHIEGKGIQHIEVVNVFGQTVLSETVTDEHVQIDLSGNAGGMYLLRIVTDNEIITNQLIKY